jgi:glutathione synthase/RimK-type ligase-like ATP-grasp enzyme
MLYLECLKNKISTPLTYLIPKKLNYNKKKIEKILMESPIVIKAVFSDKGLCVERAKTFEEFDDKLQKIINKAPTSPVIAQKYIDHGNVSYKVMMIGNRVVQSVIIKGKSWEQTGMKENENYRNFKPDKKLRELCEKASKAFNMKWCSLDLIKEKDKWYLIEVNGCPAIDFINKDMERIGNILVNYIHKEVKKSSK